MQPAMGVISTVDHASGLFVMPSITGCPTPAACSNNTAVTAQWGDGLSGTTGYVPAGTGGVLGGFNVNLYSNQTVADLGSFGNNGAFGATIHTTNGTPIDGLDVDFEPGGSVPNGTMVGVSIHFNNSTPASAYPLIGFNADATGSAGGTTAFQVTGSWKNSIVADAPATFAVGGSVANQTSAVLAHTQTAGIRALGAQAVLGSEVVDVVTIGGFAGGGYRLLNVEDSNGGNLGSGTIRFEVDAGGSIKAPYLATASTGGGFAVCVDNAGILYRRAACP
jgi:hypothetical protein